MLYLLKKMLVNTDYQFTNIRQKRPREKRVSVKDFKEENRQTLFQSDHQTEEGKVAF